MSNGWFGYLIDIANVYVDWNIDGDFNDFNEWVGQVNPTQSPSTHTISITVPVGAIPGQSRMRIVAQNNQYQPTNQALPCDVNTSWFGSTEDYTLVVSGSLSTLSNFRFSQWSGSNMFYGNPTSESGNNLYGNVSVPSGQNTGYYDLEVWDQNTNQWVQKNNAFEVIAVIIYGCTNPSATNYNPNATMDDGSCQYPSSAQINSITPSSGDQGQTLSVTISGTNMNYGNWSGTLSNFRFSQWSGSNMFYGNPTSESGNNLYGNISIPSGQNTGYYDLEVQDMSTGQWVQKNNAFEVLAITIYGCTNPSATNYNPSATMDDGSCIYPPSPISSITPNNAYQGQTLSVTISGNNLNISTWSSTIVFSQWNGSSNNIFYGSIVGSTGNNHYGTVSIDGNQTPGWYDVEVYDQNTSQWVILNNAFQVLYNPYGCTDPTAANYNSSATVDDGSCCYGANFNETFTFTNCGQTGRYGPSQSQVNNTYSGTSLAGDVTSNSGIQQWVVPQTGTYTIETFGAEGGADYINGTGGNGAKMSGEFQFNSGDVIDILVGQTGGVYNLSSQGGGGGTFVVQNGTPIIISGGGGGAHGSSYAAGGTTNSCGTSSNSGSGGCNGNGGTSYYYGAPGGGYYSNGINYHNYASNGGYSYQNGGAGGYGSSSSNAYGGFGGGGGTHGNSGGGGGGGGYSGGGGTNHVTGCGGGSYNSGTNQNNQSAVNSGNGYVIISGNINNIVYGCTDTSAFNYDPLACVDDGSCIAKIFGCANSTALNYQSFTNTNDGSCIYDINISPDSTPQGVSLQVFVSGSDTTQFIVGSEPSVLSLIHNLDSSILDVPNNYNNWQWSTADSSYGFYTNIDVDSSRLSVNISGNQSISTWNSWSTTNYYMNFSVPNSYNFNYDEPIDFQFDFTGASPYYYGGNYRIYDENNSLLLYLNNPTSYCGTTTNTYTASSSQLQQWASNGIITFRFYTDWQDANYSCDNLNCSFDDSRMILTNPGLYSLTKKADGNNGTLCDIVSQGSSITLTAPQGATISSIDYASYGNPQGSCGNFSDGWCDAYNSMSVVQSYCVGQNSCTVPATNAVFGDPCTGVNKHLAIKATYSFGNNIPQNTLMRHDAFTIYEGTPVLQQISPDTAHIGNNISVTISGFSMDFGQWSTTGLSNFKITNSTGTYYGISTSTVGDSLFGTLDIPLTAQVGLYDLEVEDQTTNQWIVLSDAFEILPIFLNPNRITPNHAFPGDSLGVFISGSQSEFTNWSQGGGAPIRLLQADGSTIPIVNLAFSNWQYNNTVGSYGFNTFIDVPQSATLGIYTLQVDHTALNNWSTLESNAFGVFYWGCTDPSAFNYNPQAIADDSSCIYYNPQLLSITPTSGEQGESLSVTISGSDMNYGYSDFRFSQWSGINMFYGQVTSVNNSGIDNNTFTFRAKGDLEYYNSYWNIYDEDGVFLTNVGYGSGTYSCNSWYTTNYTATNAQINQWTQDGSVSFSAVPTGYVGCYYSCCNNYVEVSFSSNGQSFSNQQYGGYNPAYTTNFTFNNVGNNLNGNVNIPPNQNIGWYDLEVWDQNDNQWIMLNNAFEVQAVSGCTDPNAVNYDSLATIDDGSCQYPQVNWINPSSGRQGQTLSVSISGSNMNYGSWSGTNNLSSFRFNQWSGTNIFYGTSNSASGNYLYGEVSIPPNQNLGWYELEVYDNTTNSWINKNNAFEVSTSLITPPQGDQGENLSVFISGNSSSDFSTWSCSWGIADLRLTSNTYPITTINIPNNSSNWTYNSSINSYGFYTTINIPQNATLGLYDMETLDCWWQTYASNIFTITPVSGCTDSLAANYDSTVVIDDGSCYYCNMFNTFLLNPPSSISSCDGFALSNTYSTYPVTNYIWTNYSTGQVVSNSYFASNLCNDIYIMSATDSAACTITDTLVSGVIFGCTDSTAVNYYQFANTDDGSCVPSIYGCTDSSASNYDSLSNTDDGSCCYLNVSLYISQNSPPACDGFAFASASGLNPPFTYYWSNFSTNDFIFNLCSGSYSLTVTDSVGCTVTENFTIGQIIINGCTDSTAINFDPTANTNDGSCVYNAYGCTDSTATNYDPTATVDDGSCTYPSACGNPLPTNIYVDEIIQIQAKIHWDNMSNATCMALKYHIQFRELGTSSWSWRIAQDAGLCNQSLVTTEKVMYGLTASTTYEYRMRAFYCNTSGNSGWSSIATFITADECPNVTNLTATPGPQAEKCVFSWDTVGAYSMVRIKLRVDSISNPTGSDWQMAGGFGVNYPALSVNKWGLVAGETYRGQARTWCNPSAGLYRSPNWTALIWWTQPTSIRVETSTSINNLEIYPNPSRDIFNVRFTSESIQSIDVRVVNLIGEIIFTENLVDFEGEYSHSFNLSEYSKGIYFLELETENGKINKKLILQ